MICYNKEKDPNLFSFSEKSIVTLLSIKIVILGINLSIEVPVSLKKNESYVRLKNFMMFLLKGLLFQSYSFPVFLLMY